MAWAVPRHLQQRPEACSGASRGCPLGHPGASSGVLRLSRPSIDGHVLYTFCRRAATEACKIRTTSGWRPQKHVKCVQGRPQAFWGWPGASQGVLRRPQQRPEAFPGRQGGVWVWPGTWAWVRAGVQKLDPVLGRMINIRATLPSKSPQAILELLA